MAVSTKPLPTIATIDAHLVSGNLAAAAVAMRQLAALDHSAEARAAHRRVIAAQAEAALDRGDDAAFAKAMADGFKLPSTPESLREASILFARHGELTRAQSTLPLPDQGRHFPVLLQHAADYGIRAGSWGELPDEHRAAGRAILEGFRHYEAGDDAGCREQLQAIGLASPLLEWKLMLRGLLAFSAGEDERALDNWQRLNPARLPARLTAPLRLRLDPGSGTTVRPLPTPQAAALGGSPLQSQLQGLQRVLGQKSLKSAWDSIAATAKVLQESHPDLAERLALCVYSAIERQGRPDDLPAFVKVFGPPADDPDFDRLRAVILENQAQLEEAISFWEKYEQWLASAPAGWPEPQRSRARALVLAHMADLSGHRADLDAGDLINQMFARLGRSRGVPACSPPEVYFRRAIAADPTALAPRLAFVSDLLGSENVEELVAVARDTLALDAKNVAVLTSLAAGLTVSGRYSESLKFRLEALAANPLEVALAEDASRAVLAAMRESLMTEDAAAALELYETHRGLCDTHDPIDAKVLMATVVRKLGRIKEAKVVEEAVLTAPQQRLAAAFRLSVDAALARLKPAEKTAANKRWTTALAGLATVAEVLPLIDAVEDYREHRFGYRGEKTMTKKLETLIERALSAPMTESECVRLTAALLDFERVKFIQGVCEKLFGLYPRNAQVNFILATFLDIGRPTRAVQHRIFNLLLKAKEYSGLATDAVTQKWLDQIDEAIHRNSQLYDFDDHSGSSHDRR